MKYVFYYTYYRLYQWSEKREKNIPIFITVAWLTFTMFLNVTTVLSLIMICTGANAGYLFQIHTSTRVIVAWMSAWGLLVWLWLKFFHVHEKAFSREMVMKYKELGCKDWWVITYFIASYVAMGWSAWVAGSLPS
jgi:hypothetical protein